MLDNDDGFQKLRRPSTMVVHLFLIERYEAVLTHYERLLQLLTRVTRNEASDAIDQVLEALGGRRGGVESELEQAELHHLESVYAMTLDSLKSGGYRVCTKLIHKNKWKKSIFINCVEVCIACIL